MLELLLQALRGMLPVSAFSEGQQTRFAVRSSSVFSKRAKGCAVLYSVEALKCSLASCCLTLALSSTDVTAEPSGCLAVVPVKKAYRRPDYITLRWMDGWSSEYCLLCEAWVDEWHLQSKKHTRRSKEWIAWYGEECESTEASETGENGAPTVGCSSASSATREETETGVALGVGGTDDFGHSMTLTVHESEILAELEHFLEGEWAAGVESAALVAVPPKTPRAQTSPRRVAPTQHVSLAQKQVVVAVATPWALDEKGMRTAVAEA